MPNETPSPEAPVEATPMAIRNELLQTGYAVLLSESTRIERDRLLAASLLAFGIVTAGVRVEEGISLVEGTRATFSQAWALPLGLALVIIYFLITFVIAAWLDRGTWQAKVSSTRAVKASREYVSSAIKDVDEFMETVELNRQNREKLFELEQQRIKKERELTVVERAPDPADKRTEADRARIKEQICNLNSEIEGLKQQLVLGEKRSKEQKEALENSPLPLLIGRAYYKQVGKSWAIQNVWTVGMPIFVGLLAVLLLCGKLSTLINPSLKTDVFQLSSEEAATDVG